MFRSLPVGVKRPLLLLVLLTISSTRLSTEVITKPLTKPGDFDGDSKSDVTVYRFGQWLVLKSSTDFHNSVTYGLGVDGEIPEPGDYDGDGKTDPAVFDWATGVHSILLSSTNFATHDAHQWGISTDIPEPGDYDGDGKTDIAVFRRGGATHYVLLSSTNFTTYRAHQWGISIDIPALGPTLRPTPRPASLFGAVVDSFFVCIPDAMVEVVRGQAQGQRMTQRTPCDLYDAPGFVLSGLSPGVEMTLRASAPGWSTEEKTFVPHSGLQPSVFIMLEKR